MRAAHAAGEQVIEDSMLIETRGGTIAAVPGDARNVHITIPADLEFAARLL